MFAAILSPLQEIVKIRHGLLLICLLPGRLANTSTPVSLIVLGLQTIRAYAATESVHRAPHS